MTPEAAMDRISHRRAVYPGTFDPITNGHVDILRRSLQMFEEVVVAVATNVNKSPTFTMDERIGFIREAMGDGPAASKIRFDAFDGLLVDYCRDQGAGILIRGLRAPSDFDYEFQLAVMNRKLAPTLDTIFLMTAEENFYLSSSLIKEVARFGGDISELVPACVARALTQHYAESAS